MWENQYDNIPTREPIIIPKLACDLDYMPWFRIHSKPCLLSKEERHQQIRIKREQQGSLNPLIRVGEVGTSTMPTQSPASVEQAMMPIP
ncbi:hypothetical protein J1N35_022338 [Gossypium stocksii]|uniref:Uncharacterized protein n=1 Tax=Gossypium stocksii TaxID=47602 RepID=A0A9D3VHF1_9ROSI|nr:hypothetical protein J1N35_022338 [Gossypium stocksii]